MADNLTDIELAYPSGMPPAEMRMLLAEQLGFLNAGLV